jgi:hypothetical protein
MTAPAQCSVCHETIAARSTGRQRRFCSDACRMRATRGRIALRNANPVLDTGRGVSEQNFVAISTSCRRENGDLQKASLRWIEVNPATLKLTDGIMERTPASHGQWGGFNTERGVAWVMEVGKPFGQVAWYARCGDSSYGPTSLETAKRAALSFARGAESFPESGMASSFCGQVNLHADPEVAAEMRKFERAAA